MRSFLRNLCLICLAVTLTAPVLTGCAEHRRVYDPYTQQYYVWGNEQGYYGQWENETHREHRAFQRRNEEEQREYWQWRHRHDRRDRDRDRDDRDRDHDRDRH